VVEHVRLHGGQVSVEDAAGGGARFVVELPVTRFTETPEIVEERA
jgi:signal transduction histidine kinase